MSECEETLLNLKHGYKSLTAWQEETKAETARRMYPETWLGRRRYLPGVTSDLGLEVVRGAVFAEHVYPGNGGGHPETCHHEDTYRTAGA